MFNEDNLSRPKRIYIDDPKLCNQLLNKSKLDYLSPFMTKPRSISEVAEIEDMKLSTLMYWVNTFVKGGLIKVVHEEERAGKSIKYYWASADEILFTLNVKLVESLVQRQAKEYEMLQMKNYLSGDRSNLQASIRYDAEIDHGYIQLGMIDDQDLLWENSENEYAKPLFSLTTELELSKEDTQAFYDKIRQLHQEFTAKKTSSGTKYLIHLGFLPID